MALIRRVDLSPGDTVTERLVITAPNGETTEYDNQSVVSSIRWDGLVYLEGTQRPSYARFLKKV